MIIVAVERTLEDAVPQALREAFRVMAQATLQEQGCVKYVGSVDASNPRIFRIFEIWDTMDALRLHFETPHMVVFKQAMGAFAAQSTERKIYEISGELPFPG